MPRATAGPIANRHPSPFRGGAGGEVNFLSRHAVLADRRLAGQRAVLPELVAVRFAVEVGACSLPMDVTVQVRPVEALVVRLRRVAERALPFAVNRLHVSVGEERVDPL